MKPYPTSMPKPLSEPLESRRLLAASTFDEVAALRDSADRSVDGGFAVTVNFQPDGMGNVDNTRADFGRVFTERGNGLSYGWNRDLEGDGDVFDRDTPIDHYALTQSRAVGNGPDGERQDIDERYDTGVELDIGDAWSIDVPDGKTYAVAVVSGDPDVADPDRSTPEITSYIDVNGEIFLNGRLQPHWPFAEVTGYVKAGEDGRITISVDEMSQNARLLWVRIAEVEPFEDYAEGETITWTQAGGVVADDLGVPGSSIRRAEGGGGIVGDEIVVIGGFQHNYAGTWQRVDAVNLDTLEERELAPLPEGAADTHGASAVDEERELIFWLGGEVGLENSEGFGVVNDARVFDPDGGDDGNGEWSSLPDLPGVRTSGLAFISGDRLHFLGGADETRVLDQVDHWSIDLNGALADPATADWEAMPPMPFGVNHSSVEVLRGAAEFGGDLVVVVGGEYDHGQGYSTVRHTQIYDVDVAGWTLGSEMPVAVSHVETAVRDGRIWVFGGQVRGNFVTDVVQSYDLATDTWRTHNALLQPRKVGVVYYEEAGDRFVYYVGDTRVLGIRDDSLVGTFDDEEATIV